MDDRSLSISIDAASWFDLVFDENGTPHHQVQLRRSASGSMPTSVDDHFPFTPELIASLHARRVDLDGSLFFDEMLSLAGISSSVPTHGPGNEPSQPPRRHPTNGIEEEFEDDGILELFPPKSPADLASLLREIDSCDWEQLRRDCLFYYLLRFWDHRRRQIVGYSSNENGGLRLEGEMEDRAGRFASTRMIPEGFAILADAYFYLDNGDCESAVRCLTDLRVQPDFVPKIMQTLSLPSPLPSSISPAQHVLRFVRLGKPLLTDQDSLEVYVGALCAPPTGTGYGEGQFTTNGIVEALLYVRTFPESDDETVQRARLTGMILNSCLIPKPRPEAMNTLLSFPFTDYEQTLLNTYALRPPPILPEVSLAIIQDLIIVRLIHQGKYSDAIALDKAFVATAVVAASSVANSSRSKDQSPSGPVLKAAEKRREMFKEILSVIPDIQKRVLDLSLSDEVVQHTASNGPRVQPATNPDMSMSWEDLGRLQADASAVPITPRRPTSKIPNGTPTSNGLMAPKTPLSASAAFRRAANPKVAVLRAFALANAASASTSTSAFVTSPGPDGARVSSTVMNASVLGSGARLEGSPAPGSRINRLAPAGSSSCLGAVPQSPFNVSSPFVAKSKLSRTPHRALFSQSNASAAPPVPPLPPLPIQPPLFSQPAAHGSPRHSAPAPNIPPATSRGPSQLRNSIGGRPATQGPDPFAFSKSGAPKANIPPGYNGNIFNKPSNFPPPPPIPAGGGGNPFRHSNALLRTPFAGGKTQMTVPEPVGSPLFTSTPSKPARPSPRPNKRSREATEEMEIDAAGAKENLWGGDGSADRVEFLVSSDDEGEAGLRIRNPLDRSPRGSGLNGQAEETLEQDEVEEEEVDELQDELQEEDEAEETEDLLVGSQAAHSIRQAEVPGAFPQDLPPLQEQVEPDEAQRKRSSRRSSSQKPVESREVLSGWLGADPAPPTKPPGRASSKPPVSTKPKSSSRRSTRASSVLSDAFTEDDRRSDEENNRSSKSLRRSSRLSATPAPQTQDDPPPKTKKIRASVSPSRESSVTSKTSTKKKRGSSAGPPASTTTTSRSKRRPAPILEEEEE